MTVNEMKRIFELIEKDIGGDKEVMIMITSGFYSEIEQRKEKKIQNYGIATVGYDDKDNVFIALGNFISFN